MKPTPEQIKEFDRENELDIEQWEKGDLGKNPTHTRKIPKEDSDFIKSEIEKTKTLKGFPTSIRLPHSLIAELTKLASSCGMGYQTYLRMILTKHVAETKDKEKQSA